MEMEKILISGCLLGQKVRYHRKDAFCNHPAIAAWLTEDRVVSICPEVSAGLLIPRPSCEIIGGDGQDVINQNAKVFSHSGRDRTDAFIAGANNALRLAKEFQIKIAILKGNSPSCGNRQIYDGTFTGTIIGGSGITAALLQKNGVKVYNELELDAAVNYLKTIIT